MESYQQLKFKLIDLVDFFYKHYKEMPLNWFDPIFKEFEKLRNKLESEKK
jgi:hypothetical protein